MGNSLPETNIAPEDRPSQKDNSLPTINFQVRAVRFRECTVMGDVHFTMP